MKFILSITLLACVFTAQGQTKPKTIFTIALINKSDNTVFYQFKEVIDSIQGRQTKLLRQIVKEEEIPNMLFIYTKDSTSRGGMRAKQIRVLFNSVKDRKVVISSANKVEFISNISEKLYEYYDSKLKKENFLQFTDSIINSNIDNVASAEIINMSLCNPNFSVDTIQLYLDKLSKTVQNSKFGLSVSKYIKGRKSLKEGTVVKNFILRDTSLNIIRLSDIKSEYILLDFWFSKCAPCIESFPSLLALHKKFDRSKFEIIGLSVDSEKETGLWKATIQKHHLPWINLLDPDYDISYKSFSIINYPTKLLLDKDRKIIRVNPDNAEIEKIINAK